MIRDPRGRDAGERLARPHGAPPRARAERRDAGHLGAARRLGDRRRGARGEELGHRARGRRRARPFPAGPVAYVRLRALGETRSYGPSALEKVVRAIGPRRDAYVVFETD